MLVPADRVIALGIYCRYCILRRRILTELVFGGHDARQTEGTPDPPPQGLAGLREAGGAPRYRAPTTPSCALARGPPTASVRGPMIA